MSKDKEKEKRDANGLEEKRNQHNMDEISFFFHY